MATVPFPETIPPYSNFVVDVEGNLWVEDYQRPWDDQPLWAVLSREGAWLGLVYTPPGFKIFQVGSNFVLGRWEDELGVDMCDSTT